MAAPVTPALAPAPGSLGNRLAGPLALLLAIVAPVGGRSQPPNVFEAVEDLPAATDAADEPAEPGLFFPSDRTRERDLDRARRLIADARWSDAAVALDELLAGEQDAFVVAGAGTTRGSIRSTAAAAVADLPRPGRDAYRRLFDGRAAKQLAAAIAADDHDGVVAVARRWLHTAAGRQAALLAGLSLLESGQHLAAAASLDRLAGLEGAGDFEPTLTVMRAIARSRTGDEQAVEQLLPSAGRRGPSSVRLAGRDLTIPAAIDYTVTLDCDAKTFTGEDGTNMIGGLSYGPEVVRKDWLTVDPSLGANTFSLTESTLARVDLTISYEARAL